MHCNAVTTAIRAYRPEDDHWAQAAAPGAAAPTIRHDGWTPFRQQVFLRSIAEGATVELACAGVGLSPQSAYAFRNRASGAAFALGWAAARLLGRERMADTLLTRALEGQIETVTRDDGSTVDRLKYDNRLALGLLTRLDRQAESPAGQAARLVAQEFEAFTDAIGRDDSPARAGLFLGTRALGEAEAELAPVIALARADRFARTGAGLPQEIDTSDLDLVRRADWTADQWQRAEAAGLLTIAPLPLAGGAGGEPEEEQDEDEEDDALSSSPQFPQLRDESLPPVWDDPDHGLVTDFPPPDDYDGKEVGIWGTDYYMRTLTAEEEIAWEARPPEPEDEEFEQARASDARARDLFFGFLEDEAVEEEKEEAAAEDAEDGEPDPADVSSPPAS